MISTLQITWENSIGIVNSTPSYGYDLNSLLIFLMFLMIVPLANWLQFPHVRPNG